MATPAHAGTIAAAEVSYDKALLSNFNLVTLGDYTNAVANSRLGIDGRVIVGGNLNVTAANAGTYACGSSTAATVSGPAKCGGDATVAVDATQKLYGTLTVFGNLVAPSGGIAPGNYIPYNTTTATTVSGTTYIGGTANGYMYAGNNQNLNIRGSASGLQVDYARNVTTSQANFLGSATNRTSGSTTTATTNPTTNTAAAVFPFSNSKLTTEIKNLAAGIAALPGTPGVAVQTLASGFGANSSAFITANADWNASGKRYGVVTTTVSELAGRTGGVTINNNGMDATFVIVKGDCPTCLLPTLNSYAGNNKIIFDFVDATALKFAGAWNASILAPLATITQTSASATIDGSVIVNAISQSQAIYSTNLFAGDLTGLIPEPTSMSLLGLGVAGAAMIRRRRKLKRVA